MDHYRSDLVKIEIHKYGKIIRLDWIEQGLTSPPTQYRLSGRQFYRSKDPTNSIKVLKEKNLIFADEGMNGWYSTDRRMNFMKFLVTKRIAKVSAIGD